MAQQLTLEKIRTDTLKYLNSHGYTRNELAFLIGVTPSSLYRFLKCNVGLHTKYLINLLNLLYYDNETENSL